MSAQKCEALQNAASGALRMGIAATALLSQSGARPDDARPQRSREGTERCIAAKTPILLS